MPVEALQEICSDEARDARVGVWAWYLPDEASPEGDWLQAELIPAYREALDRARSRALQVMETVDSWTAEKLEEVAALIPFQYHGGDTSYLGDLADMDSLWNTSDALSTAWSDVDMLGSNLRTARGAGGAPRGYPVRDVAIHDRVDDGRFDVWLDDVERRMAHDPRSSWGGSVTEPAIREAEAFFGYALPPSYRAFLFRSNGACAGVFCVPGVKEAFETAGVDDLRFWPRYWTRLGMAHPPGIIVLWDGGHPDVDDDEVSYVLNPYRGQWPEFGVDIYTIPDPDQPAVLVPFKD